MKTNNLLPSHYTEVSEPIFNGKGEHSVKQLEDIAEQYKELTHQLRIKEQALREINNDLSNVLTEAAPILDILILSTPSGKKRNQLCDLNMKINSKILNTPL